MRTLQDRLQTAIDDAHRIDGEHDGGGGNDVSSAPETAPGGVAITILAPAHSSVGQTTRRTEVKTPTPDGRFDRLATLRSNR